jgi:hypothetical protein
MSGCYSNSDFDKWLEEQADKYYDEEEEEEEDEEEEEEEEIEWGED